MPKRNKVNKLTYGCTGLVGMIAVYNNQGQLIATGWIPWTIDFGPGEAILIDSDGNPLGLGLYDIQTVDTKVAFISGEIH